MTAIVGSAVMPNAIYAQPEEDLIMRCVVAAARDAAIARDEIGAVIAMTPRPTTVQHYQTQHITARLGLHIDVLCEVEMAALGLCNALRMAEALIHDRGVPAVAIFASSRESAVPSTEYFGSRSARTADASFVGPFGMVPAVWNALAARQMIADGEATESDFANVSVRLRRQATRNPLAYFRKEVTIEDVLSSRMIASPLRLLMVCPRTDGAACVIIGREDIVRRSAGRAVAHKAQGMAHDGDSIVAERAGRSMWAMPATTRAIDDAFERASLDHDAVDVIEPWIPFAPMEMMVMRGLGFGRDYAERVAVSPSGGPIARGYPLLATGFYNLHEVVLQLRGEAGARQVPAARVGMTVSETGNYNECVVDLFERVATA